MNQPESLEARLVWELVMKLGFQVRAVQGAILGWDFSAAFALADAMGIPRQAVAVFLPEIEAVAIPRINERIRQEQD